MSKQLTTKLVFGLVLGIAFGTMVAAFSSINICYTEPCHEGSGLRMLWSVHPGQSFQVISLSVGALFAVLFSINVLFRSTPTKFTYGIVLVLLIGFAIISFFQMGVWSIKTVMMKDLEVHAGPGEHLYQESSDCSRYTDFEACHNATQCGWYSNHCMRYTTLDVDIEPRFTAGAVLFGLLMFSLLILTGLLMLWKDTFVPDVTKSDNSSYVSFVPNRPGSGRGQPQAANGNYSTTSSITNPALTAPISNTASLLLTREL